MSAKVIQINTKSKIPGEVGLPKHARQDPIRITKMGVGDDYNHYRTVSKGGTENRAVLIYTTDKIKELNDEGWPLQPGDIGENLTVDGISYDSINIGNRIQVGEVELEVAEVCNPCNNLRALDYVGQDKIKEFIQTMKGRRGWYCKVLQEGTININDRVVIK